MAQFRTHFSLTLQVTRDNIIACQLALRMPVLQAVRAPILVHDCSQNFVLVEQEDNNNNGIQETQETNDKQESILAPPSTLSVVELYARRQQKLNERRLRIAELSNAVLEKPEENVCSLLFYCLLFFATLIVSYFLSIAKRKRLPKF